METILNNIRTSGRITIPDLKLYYRGIIIKIGWYWYKDRQVDQWNRTEDPEMNLHSFGHLIFDKRAKTFQWNTDSLFNKWCWFNWQSACRRMQINPIFFSFQVWWIPSIVFSRTGLMVVNFFGLIFHDGVSLFLLWQMTVLCLYWNGNWVRLGGHWQSAEPAMIVDDLWNTRRSFRHSQEEWARLGWKWSPRDLGAKSWVALAQCKETMQREACFRKLQATQLCCMAGNFLWTWSCRHRSFHVFLCMQKWHLGMRIG